jgi:diphosphomevalonate decarboxylase
MSASRKSPMRASASACSNIAFLKYWGKRDAALNIPLNDSMSMALSEATTSTTVVWDSALAQDELYIDGERVLDRRLLRVSRYLDRIRQDWYRMPARVASQNSFPASTGIASSASAFAALAAAAISATGDPAPGPEDLSRWARRGSGSACRSIHGGFVEWIAGTDDDSSVARPLCSPGHWDLRDLVVVVTREPKAIPSSEGHAAAARHPFMAMRQELLPARLLAMKGALAARDLPTLGVLLEREALEVQALMLSAEPSALYLQPDTVRLLHAVRAWRDEDGVPAWFTLDAGPNVHLICEAARAPELRRRVRELLPRADLLENRPGPGVLIHDAHLC